MAKVETTTPRVQVELIDKYLTKGRRITHNPRCSFSDALYAVLGRLEELERRERAARKVVEITEPVNGAEGS